MYILFYIFFLLFIHTYICIYIHTYIYKYNLYMCMYIYIWGFSGDSVVKNLPANAGDIRNAGMIPRSGRCPG